MRMVLVRRSCEHHATNALTLLYIPCIPLSHKQCLSTIDQVWDNPPVLIVTLSLHSCPSAVHGFDLGHQQLGHTLQGSVEEVPLEQRCSAQQQI